MTDAYALAAEFSGFARLMFPNILADLPKCLDGVDTSLPILDLGAGTGAGTFALAEALPDASIVAIEPAASQRIALMTRLSDRPDLHQRVTVVPQDLFRADLPPQWGGATLIHVLCSIDGEQRRRLLHLVAERLADGAPAIAEWHYDVDEPAAVERMMVYSFNLGEHEYQRWFAASPTGPNATLVHVTYRILHGDTVVAEQNEQTEFPLIRGSVLLDEIAAAGLTAERVGDHLLVLRRAPASTSAQ